MEQTRRERNKQMCRGRILKASRRLFSTKGYEQTTMEDVALRAEVSKATLYNYFISKESLLLGIAEAELDDIRQLINVDLAQEPSAVKKLRRVLQSFVLDSVNYINLCRKITSLNSNPGSELYHTRVKMLEIFRQLVLEGQKNGELRPEANPDDIVELVMGVYLVSQFHWTDIDTSTAVYCITRLDQCFDRMLEGILL